MRAADAANDYAQRNSGREFRWYLHGAVEHLPVTQLACFEKVQKAGCHKLNNLQEVSRGLGLLSDTYFGCRRAGFTQMRNTVLYAEFARGTQTHQRERLLLQYDALQLQQVWMSQIFHHQCFAHEILLRFAVVCLPDCLDGNPTDKVSWGRGPLKHVHTTQAAQVAASLDASGCQRRPCTPSRWRTAGHSKSPRRPCQICRGQSLRQPPHPRETLPRLR